MSGRWFDLREVMPWMRGDIVHAVNTRDEPKVRAGLEEAGFRIVTVEGASVKGALSLFDEFARVLDLPAHFGRNWDGLADVLGEGWETAGPLAVVWRDADQSFASDAQSFLDAVRLMSDTAADVGMLDEDGSVGAQVEVFLLGAGF